MFGGGQAQRESKPALRRTGAGSDQSDFARDAALKVAEEGLRWVIGAGGVNDGEIAGLEASLGLPAIHRAQSGLISDLDYVADVLYGRAAKTALAA